MKTGIVIAGLLLSLGIAVYAFNGLYSRYMADDYCLASETRGRDLFWVIADRYQRASGRVAQTIALTATLSLGVGFAAVSPALLLLLSIVGLAWSVLPLARRFAPAYPVLAALVTALALVLAALAGTPQIAQTLYWIEGAYTYTVPLMLSSLLLGVVLRARSWALPGIAMLVLTTAAGTFSEPNATWQLALLLAALLASAPLGASRAQVAALVMGVIGAGLAVFILLLAPGNALRAAAFTPSGSVLATGVGSVQYALLYALALAPRLAPLALLALFTVPMLIALAVPRLPALPPRRLGWALLLWIGVGIAALAAFMAPGIHATAAPPPARSFIVPSFSWSITVIGAGCLFGMIVRARRANRPISTRLAGLLALVLIALVVGATAVRELATTPLYAQHAAEWDARDRLLRAAEGVATVPPLTFDLAVGTGLETLTANPSDWVNLCAAAYYDLDFIRVE